ncbi:MAG: hypothetical protein ACKO2P_19460 [Planctomycetota bacterium]
MKSLCQLTTVVLLTALSVGCASETPGTWKQPKVEAEVVQRLKLTSISLSPVSGGFEGTGTAQDGETYRLKIAQDSAKGRLSWVAEGDRGSEEEGSIEVQ